MLRHRHHRQDTGNIAVMIKFFDSGNNFFLCCCFRHCQHLGFTAKTFYQFYQTVFINMRSRVISHHNDRQSNFDPFFLCGCDLG